MRFFRMTIVPLLAVSLIGVPGQATPGSWRIGRLAPQFRTAKDPARQYLIADKIGRLVYAKRLGVVHNAQAMVERKAMVPHMLGDNLTKSQIATVESALERHHDRRYGALK